MAVDMTQSFVNIDIQNDAWQNQVIDAFDAVDAGGNDITANDAGSHEGQAGWSVGNTGTANANGCVVTTGGDVIKVDGSAFLYSSEQFSTRQTNKASGLAGTAKIPDAVNSALNRKLA